MLCLSRRVGETIRVGQNIRVAVLEVRDNQVRIGVATPNSVDVHREEVYRLVKNNKIS
ncbi:carbon storage regulator CsrA [Pseudomonas fluorescens]|uniref:carbon storage regulator CsrA n=1 Tax=Pseudomonas fluorescens TaxID=294 RepID=UPI000CD1D1D8|nr:carbon storage regulator CsrA [Pseudomonas fluorescens]PNY78788.1 carbon storage regulator [Pseudomonas fluorescens]